MDSRSSTEPGGEQTQYEAIKEHTIPPAKQRGQLGTGPNSSEPSDAVSQSRGEKTAENIRYGQGISEGGFGGQTTTTSGTALQGGPGRTAADKREEQPGDNRKAQGYGPGSGVGA